MQDQTLVSIIIVSTHEENFLVQLLDSIYRIEDSLSFEIIIVDNDSKGTLASFLRQDIARVKIISLSENAGFCKANNAGLRIAAGEYVLLLNPDTLLRQPAISECIGYFENHSAEKIGAVACRLNNADGSPQKSFFRLAASIRRTLQANAVYLKFFGQKIKRKAERFDDELHKKISAVPWLCGAFLLIKREILIKENFFLDEDFFLYSDDVEIGYRIRSRGYRLIYLPEISITHFGGGNRPFLKRFEQLTISEWLCMMKIHGKFYFFFNQTLVMVNIAMDELLSRFAALRGSITMHDLREKIIRRKLWSLWRQFTFRVLMRYHRKPSSSKSMLKYN